MEKTSFYIEKFNSTVDIIRYYDKIESFETKYQKIDIIKNSNNKNFECMFINNGFQSSMEDEFFYHEAIVHPAMFAHQNPKDVLIIGGGAGTTLREVLKHPVDSITMIDLDKEFVDWCKENKKEWHLGSLSDSKVNFIFADALQEIKKINKKFDIIIIDLVTILDQELFGDENVNSTIDLYSEIFYSDCKMAFKSKESILVTQAHGLTKSDESYKRHFYIHKQLKKVFNIVKDYSVYIESWCYNNSFIICSDAIDASKNDTLRTKDIEEMQNKFKIYDIDFHKHMFYLNRLQQQLLENSN